MHHDSGQMATKLAYGGRVTTASLGTVADTETFRHQAVFYRGLDDMTDRVAPFILEGVALGEPVLVAALPDRVSALSDVLGPAAERVSFLDMGEIGRNPARIIPEWRRFVDKHAGKPSMRGVGEPVWASRRADELDECRLHEALLNVAFDDGPGWQLMCPYDAGALPAHVIEDAMRTHPVVGLDEASRHRQYGGHLQAQREFERPLSNPPDGAEQITFGEGDLAGLRSVVHTLGGRARLSPDVVDDLVLAAHELACNSIKHGGGGGVLRAWDGPGSLVVELSDRGVISNPLVGREPALELAETGRGVWIVNQLCDLVQVRSSSAGTTVRLHTWL